MRNLYLKTISVEEAHKKYYDSLKRTNFSFFDIEFVNTIDSLGRITSEAIYAKNNSPAFNAAAMDGVCVDSKVTKNASEENPVILKIGKDIKVVDTGDPINIPYDAVIMAEDLIQIDESTYKIISPISGWENVRPIGEDIVKGEMIIESNHIIKPIDIGALVAGGIVGFNCYKKKTAGPVWTGGFCYLNIYL